MDALTSADDRAKGLGVPLGPGETSYLDRCARVGTMYYTSGHTSATVGTLGDDLSVAQGREAALESARRLFASVYAAHGTLDGLRVVRMLTCVRATPEFTQHPEVVNAASDLVHEIFGHVNGHHARSALGFTSLPGGAAVEIEAILEIVAPPG